MADMNFNFDKMSLNNFHIGGVVMNSGNDAITDRRSGYSVTIKNSKITHISIYFNNKSYGFSKFNGAIKKGLKFIKINENSSLNSIKKIFDAPFEQWQDEVEINLQFIIDRYRIEFSWDTEGEIPLLMYFCVEERNK